MIPYQPAGAHRTSLPNPARIAYQGKKTLGETFDQLLGFGPGFGDFLRLVGHSLGAWVGIYVGARGKGWIRGVGWVIGVGQGLAGVCDLVSIVQRATRPAQETTMETPPSVAGPAPLRLVK